MAKRLFIITVVVAICLLSSAKPASASDRIERFNIKSDDGKITYAVRVWLPPSYIAQPRPFPMLLMLDGEYAFDAAVQISAYLQRSEEIEEFIVVGLSYDVGFGEPLAAERTRDFTPPVDDTRSITKSETVYYRFIKNGLLPRLRERYRIDPANRALWGYSLSGSFAAWLNYFDPSLFDHYILASGNLIDFGISQKLFQGRIFSGGEYHRRRVVLSYDMTEIPDPKVIEDAPMLLSREDTFPGYDIKFFLTKGESHVSSWFVSLPTSLRHVFGRKAQNHDTSAPLPAASAAQPR